MHYIVGDTLAEALKQAWSKGHTDDRLGVVTVYCAIAGMYISIATTIVKQFN